MTSQPIDATRLDEIATRAAHLYEYATSQDGEGDTLAGEDVPALLAEIQRLRTELEKQERLHGETIDDRDRAQDAADKLAYAVAPEGVISEHTADNSPWENALDLITPMAEVDTLRQQVAVFATLSDRWDQMATTGDAAIGTFPGPAAATLDAEVGERGRTYRKAAADVRDTLRTGHIPHDLMTDAELKQHGTTEETTA